MKTFKIFIIIFLSLFLINNTFAGKGYNVSYMSWSVKSGWRCCPSGKVLLDLWKNRSLARSGTAMCFIPDNTAPTINISGYTSGTWTKNDVNITVTVSDVGSKINNIYYTINGEKQATYTLNNYPSYTFNIPTIKEEGTYNIIIYAQDNAINSSINGTKVTPNIATKKIQINIDRTAPTYVVQPNITNNEWINENKIIDFKIDDTYKGRVIQEKVFDCGNLTNNTQWIYPVDENGNVTGYCDNTDGKTDCSLDKNFSLNTDDCNYVCNENYLQAEDGLCYISSLENQCNSDLLPSYVYEYNSNNELVKKGNSDGKIIWDKPNNIGLDGTFYSYLNVSTLEYSPSIKDCSYKCNLGYHKEGKNCVNDTKIICCGNPYLSYSTLGTRTDCTLKENQSKIECVESSICGWDKELLGLWEILKSDWLYITDTDGELSGDSGRESMCGYEFFENSNGKTCNPYYYLIKNSNGKPIECEEVGNGYWSSQDNEIYECTNNKPKHSYYSSAGDNNNCEWTCDSGYNIEGNDCIQDKTGGEKVVEDNCEGGTCIYTYKINYFDDNECTNLKYENTIKSNEFNTLTDCNKELEKEKFDNCERKKHYSKIKTLVEGCH